MCQRLYCLSMNTGCAPCFERGAHLLFSETAFYSVIFNFIIIICYVIDEIRDQYREYLSILD